MNIFFARTFFEILQTQNLVSFLKLPKENTMLIIWGNSDQEIEQYIEENVFGSVFYVIRPSWKYIRLNTGIYNLKKAYAELTLIFQKQEISEVFIPDPKKEFQLVENICQKNNIPLSLYETGFSTYRFLRKNRQSLAYKFHVWKKNIINILKNYRSQIVIRLFNYIFYRMFPNIGQFFLPKDVRRVLFRIQKFHRCFCTNPESISKIYQVNQCIILNFEALVSHKQQMLIFSSPEFWQITPNHMIFIDQNYLILGVTPEQHVHIVLKCLESYGRIHNIIIKPIWSTSNEVEDIYRKNIARKGYNISILSAKVIAETIIVTKNTRRMVSLAGVSYIYSKKMKPTLRTDNLYKRYEEIAIDYGISHDVLQNIRSYHQLYETIFLEIEEKVIPRKLDSGFFVYDEKNS